MKIILSRKGFDSAYGGYPSPILLDGRMVSLPIPSNDEIKYSDLKLDNQRTYFDLMKQLKSRIRYGQKWHELTKDTECHLDPDVRKDILSNRGNNWRGSFGQVGAAQSHLNNQDIKLGDLFLFFGTFQKTIDIGNNIKFSEEYPFHAIWGFLRIGRIVKVNSGEIERDSNLFFLKKHPHYLNRNIYNENNTIYLSAKEDDFGVFKYHNDLVLTKRDQNQKSLWELPRFFYGLKITYHKPENQRINENGKCEFRSASRGQEFVIEENDMVTDWAEKLIENYENNL